MRKLHDTLFHKKLENEEDKSYLFQVKQLQWVTPKQFGVPDSEVVFKPRSWDLAIKIMKNLP